MSNYEQGIEQDKKSMCSHKKLSISDFQSEVPQEYSDFVLQAHELLTQYGYKSKIQLKRHGLSAQYNSPNQKGFNGLQFIVCGNELLMYLYNIFFYDFNGFLENLPQVVIEQYDGYRNCIDACDPVCEEGKRNYYAIGSKQYRKCSVGRQLFTINEEIAAGILSVLQK